MKVYSCPAEVPPPEVDYRNFDRHKVAADEAAHRRALKKWLVDRGYRGPHTGKVLDVPMGDGYALYMLADGPKSALIHLPYGDAWNSRDVQFLPKREVLERIAQRERIAALFTTKAD